MITVGCILIALVLVLFSYTYLLRGRINKVHHDNQYEIKFLSGRLNMKVDKDPNHYSS